jgi:hypothetical protein
MSINEYRAIRRGDFKGVPTLTVVPVVRLSALKPTMRNDANIRPDAIMSARNE